MLLNCPVNGNAQSREPVNQDYSRASKRQKETIIRFKNIAFPLPHSLYLNLHLIGSLQHCQNYILRTRRSFQTFMPCYVHGSEPLRKKDRAFFCKRFRKQQIPDTMRDGKLILTSVRNQYPPIHWGHTCWLQLSPTLPPASTGGSYHLDLPLCLVPCRHEIKASGITNEGLCDLCNKRSQLSHPGFHIQFQKLCCKRPSDFSCSFL